MSYILISHDLHVLKPLSHHTRWRSNRAALWKLTPLFKGPKTDYAKDLLEAASYFDFAPPDDLAVDCVKSHQRLRRT